MAGRGVLSRVRLDLSAIESTLHEVQDSWHSIDTDLQRHRIGRKDAFTSVLRDNMLSAYAYLDELLAEQVEPFSDDSIATMLELNNRVHYGTNRALKAEYASAIAANSEKFYGNIGTIVAWYRKHAGRGDHPFKLAAETYVSILGRPQLFIEGNHRSGSLIASWINLHTGYAPFVLSVDNAVAYFEPSAEIKLFADRSTWRGQARLPKYRKSFRHFWERHVEDKYVVSDTHGSLRGSAPSRPA
jgi:hypothetical protein